MTVKLYPNEVVLNAGDTNQMVDNNTVDTKHKHQMTTKVYHNHTYS